MAILISAAEEAALNNQINLQLPDGGPIYPVNERQAIWILYTLVKQKLGEAATDVASSNLTITDIQNLSTELADIKTDILTLEAQVANLSAGELVQLYNALDQTVTGFALDATQGKILYDQLLALGIRVTELENFGIGGGSGSGGGVYWVRRPTLELSGSTVTVTNTADLAPVANWNGEPVPFATGVIPYTFNYAATSGYYIVYAIVANSNEVYEIITDGEQPSPIFPSNLGNRLLVGYVLMTTSGGSVTVPDSSYVTHQQLNVELSDYALKSELHSHANKNALDKVTDAGDGTLVLHNDGTYKAVTSNDSGSTVTDSTVNGNILVDGAELQTYNEERVIKQVVSSASTVTGVWSGTLAQYEAIATKDATILYFIQ